MIHSCTCTSPIPSIRNSSSLTGLELCKTCGGRAVPGRRTSISSNMPDVVGVEHPRPIDPGVKWKITCKGRQRAARRPRTSFAMVDGNMVSGKMAKECENEAVQGPRKSEVPASESEKLGVTILGRHFSDPIGSMPIKKRRFVLVRSPSPPSASSSRQLHQSELGDHHWVTSVSQRKNEGQADAADFSGISLLAAAACGSGLDGDGWNNEHPIPISLSVEGKRLEQIKPCTEQTRIPGNSPRKSEEFSVATSVAEPLEITQSDGSDKFKAISDCHSLSEKTKVESARDSRLHWDLNVAVEAWQCGFDDEFADQVATTAAAVENLACDDKCNGMVSSVDIGEPPQMKAASKTSGMLENVEMQQDSSVPNDIHSLPCTNLNSASGSFSSEPQEPNISDQLRNSKSSSVIAHISEEASPLCSIDRSTIVQELVTLPSADASRSSSECNMCIKAANAVYSGHMQSEMLNSDSGFERTDITADLPSALLSNGRASSNRDETSFAVKNVVADGDDWIRICPSKLNTVEGDVNMDRIDVEESAPSDGTEPIFIAMDGAVTSNMVIKSIPSEYDRNSAKVVSNDCMDIGYVSDASHVGTESAEALDKVDYGDDDSQFEDGELRDSGHIYWDRDGFEEVETERVDYDSDWKEDMLEDPPNPPASEPVDSVAQVTLGLPSAASTDAMHARVNDSDEALLPTPLSSALLNGLDAPAGKKETESNCENTLSLPLPEDDNQNHVTSEYLTILGSTGERNCGIDASLREDPSSLTGKSWDRLSQSRSSSRHYMKDGADSASDNSSDSEQNGYSPSRPLRPPFVRDLPLAMGQRRPFDRTGRNNEFYERNIPSFNDGCRTSLRIERTRGRRPYGRGGTLRNSYVADRVERWVDDSRRSGSSRRRSPMHYNYGPTGVVNAAAATVAKMESNGFVVAADGTLVKAVATGAAPRAPRRPVSAALHSSHQPMTGRDSTVDRDRVYSRGRASTRNVGPDRRYDVGRNRSLVQYHPEMNMDQFSRTRTNGGASSNYHSLSRRESSFSPHRSDHLSRSHTGSPTRSRSHSSQPWTPLRRRRTSGVGGVSSLNHGSRSPPNYQHDVRAERMSPQPNRRTVFDRRTMRYNSSPSSRNHAFGNHNSRWQDERQELLSFDDVHDFSYKRNSRRSPPQRISSHSDKHDLADLSARSRRGGGVYNSSSRNQTYGGFRKRGRQDEDGDHRTSFGHVQAERNGSSRQFRDGSFDGFRSLDCRGHKTGEFGQRGKSPGNLDKGCIRRKHLGGNSAEQPPGDKEEKDGLRA